MLLNLPVIVLVPFFKNEIKTKIKTINDIKMEPFLESLTRQSLWTVKSCQSFLLMMIKIYYLVWTVNTRHLKTSVKFWTWISQGSVQLVQYVLTSFFSLCHAFSYHLKHFTTILKPESTSAVRMDYQQVFGHSIFD